MVSLVTSHHGCIYLHFSTTQRFQGRHRAGAGGPEPSRRLLEATASIEFPSRGLKFRATEGPASLVILQKSGRDLYLTYCVMSRRAGIVERGYLKIQPNSRDGSLLRVAEAVQLLLELISFLPLPEGFVRRPLHSEHFGAQDFSAEFRFTEEK